jgi:phospholipid N-methyltransferase
LKKIKEKIEFMYQFLGEPKTIGSIFPSSKFLADKILSYIDFSEEGLVIIEYGPGTGPFTTEIVKQLKPTDRLIVIEINNKFAKNLQEKYKDYKNISIYEDSVANTSIILEKEKLKKVDYIISGIPFSSIPKEITDDILKCAQNVMQENTLFLTFQYSKLKTETFKKYFTILSTKFVMRNIPSAFVFCMKNK